MRPEPFASDEEIAGIVRRFEDLSFPFSEWHHRAHLAVATWYVTHHDLEEAQRLMREGVQRYNAFHKIEVTRESGYHETLTLFWIEFIYRLLAGAGPSLVERGNRVLDACGDKFLLRQYYSRDLIMSWRARLEWVDPDLRSIGARGPAGADPPPAT